MPRFFVEAGGWEEEQVWLSAAEAHHLMHVLRGRSGESVVVFDGCGREARALIPAGVAGASSAGLSLRLEPASVVVEAAPPDITLLQALLKGPRMDFLIEKATELGARRIVPVMTERAVVRLDGAQAGERVERWQRLALGAAKQCGTRWLPVIAPVCDIKAAVAQVADEPGRRNLVGALTGATQPLQAALTGLGAAGRVAVLIGPEGDLTPGELAGAQAKGFLPVSFGPRVLRGETAGIFAVCAAQYEMLR